MPMLEPMTDEPRKPADRSSSEQAPSQSPRSAVVSSQLHFDEDLANLRRRLVRSATGAVEMLERAIAGLWALDEHAAAEVRVAERTADAEEVAIEKECLRLLALQQPFGSDFRFLAFCLKANADIERVADHADAVAKITLRLAADGPAPAWPTALTDLGERVPMICHRLLRAVLDEDEAAARSLVGSDEVIDSLDKRLFSELGSLLERGALTPGSVMLMHRIGRELERVGDLMCNIAEDVVYLATGEIIRHAKDRSAPGKP